MKLSIIFFFRCNTLFKQNYTKKKKMCQEGWDKTRNNRDIITILFGY